MGLFHYTTQTNQTKEATSILDLGYHFVAVDANGKAIDTNGNGIPDYLEDYKGAGLFSIFLLAPLNSSVYSEPATLSIQASVIDWSGSATNVEFRRASTPIVDLASVPYLYSWPSVSAGAYSLTGVAYDIGGSRATSAPVAITITNLCGTP